MLALFLEIEGIDNELAYSLGFFFGPGRPRDLAPGSV
jgi:hypothetical protein